MTNITIILKNISGTIVTINDLGFTLQAGESRVLTDDFSIFDISNSNDLITVITSGLCIVNNGTVDLSMSDSLKDINFKTEFQDPNTSGTFTTAATPTDPTTLWLNPNQNNLPQSFNPSTSSWLSISRNIYTFTGNSKTNGMNLSISSGWWGNDFYFIGRQSVITSIYSKILSGNLNKSFVIMNDTTPLFTYSHVNSLQYINLTSNIIIPAGSLLKIHVNYDANNSVSNPIVQLEVAYS